MAPKRGRGDRGWGLQTKSSPSRGGEELWSRGGRVPKGLSDQGRNPHPNWAPESSSREEVPGAAASSGVGGGSLTSSVGTALWDKCRDSHLILPPGVRKAAHSWTTVPSPIASPRGLPVSSPGWVSGVGFCRLDHLALVHTEFTHSACCLSVPCSQTPFISVSASTTSGNPNAGL